MGNKDSPMLVLVLSTSLITAITGGVFGVWARYDVIPSTLDNNYETTKCNIVSSEIISDSEQCACYEEGLSCTYVYPCVVIKVKVNNSLLGKTLTMYKDLTSYTFSSKCSFYPVGKLCADNSQNTTSRCLLFKQQRGQVGSDVKCFVNDRRNPTIVVAENSERYKGKLILFVLSVVLFFFPLAFINCFFLYKWKVMSCLGTSFTRHNRVASMQMNPSFQRRDTAFTTAQFETD